MPVLRALLAIGAGLALADASVVTLALPPMLTDLDTTVEGVAAVIGVYTLVLAAALPAAAWLRRRTSDRALGAGGFALFAVAGALCATPEGVGEMLAFRALQAVGAAAALVAGFALLRGGRLWTAAAVFGTAVGPALGGALTQAFDWRAIFLFQVPLALAAAAASLLTREEAAGDEAAPTPATSGGLWAAPAPQDPAAPGSSAPARRWSAPGPGAAAAPGSSAAGPGSSAAGPGSSAAASGGAGAPGSPAAARGRSAPAPGAAARSGSSAGAHGSSAAASRWSAPAPGAAAPPGSPAAAPGSSAAASAGDGAPSRDAGGVGAVVALAGLSAALTGVLFLLVLLLVSGWSLEPLAAAAAVSVLPLAAFAGARVRGDAALRASAGCALVGGGVLALAALPGASWAWIVAPQLLAGLGMGMALPALAGELLPERTPDQAARLLSVRHAGITLALVMLAPVAAAQLDRAVDDVRERGAALMLDARLPPLDKLELAGPLVAELDPVNPRDRLREALDAEAGRFADDPEQRREYAALTERADDTLLAGIDASFRIAFLIAGGLALVGAVAVLPKGARGRTVAIGVAAAALALPAVHALVRPALAPEPVVIADPCEPRDLPATGGIDGLVQDAALAALDRAACRYGSSREELALAMADEDHARAYRERHGIDPRSTDGLLELLGITLG